mgnify:CR=1 FL=1
MKLPSKPVIALISIPIVILLFFSSNIYGYFRFKHYCSAEGGLRVYEKLERNVGWLAKDKYEARTAALLDGVGFVRYTDKNDGKSYDIKYIGGDPQDDGSFEKYNMDGSKSIRYVWKSINQPVANELRLRRYGEEILDVKDNRVLAQYYMLGYEKLNRSNTLLDMPTEIYCFNDPVTKFGNFDGWISSVNKIFRSLKGS